MKENRKMKDKRLSKQSQRHIFAQNFEISQRYEGKLLILQLSFNLSTGCKFFSKELTFIILKIKKSKRIVKRYNQAWGIWV